MHIDRKSPFALEDWIVEPEFNHLTLSESSQPTVNRDLE